MHSKKVKNLKMVVHHGLVASGCLYYCDVVYHSFHMNANDAGQTYQVINYSDYTMICWAKMQFGVLLSCNWDCIKIIVRSMGV
jgi:hypothetical protein